MPGDDQKQTAMFSYLTLAQRIPMDHPARQMRALVDRALARMDGELEKLYSDTGRPSIAPERLLRATLSMVLYSIRGERQLMEQMNYNLLFRWFPPQRRRPVAGGPEFVGLEMDDAVWDVTVFTKNREWGIAPHVSEYTKGEQKMAKNSLTDKERSDERCAMSQRKRKLIEKVFGWAKQDRVLRQVKVQSLKRVDWLCRLTMAAYNLMRLRRLIPIAALAC